MVKDTTPRSKFCTATILENLRVHIFRGDILKIGSQK